MDSRMHRRIDVMYLDIKISVETAPDGLLGSVGRLVQLLEPAGVGQDGADGHEAVNEARQYETRGDG